MPTPNYLVVPITKFPLDHEDLFKVNARLDEFVGKPARLEKNRTRLNVIETYCQGPWTPDPTPPRMSMFFMGTRAAQQRDRFATSIFFQRRSQILEEIHNISLQVYFGEMAIPHGQTVLTLARRIVRHNWLKQGIYRDEWSEELDLDDLWAHEELESPEPEPEDLEDLTLRERKLFMLERALRARRRQLSRPFYSFLFHVAEEGNWMERAVIAGKQLDIPIDPELPDFKAIRARWEAWNIWDDSWGALPGLTWKHERALHDPDETEAPQETSFRVGHPPGLPKPPPQYHWQYKYGKHTCPPSSEPPIKPNRRRMRCKCGNRRFTQPKKQAPKPKKEGRKNASAKKVASTRGSVNLNKGRGQGRAPPRWNSTSLRK